MESLEVFPRRIRICKNIVLDRPDASDEVLDSLEALVATLVEEFVRLLRVVQVGKVLPFDVVALEMGRR